MIAIILVNYQSYTDTLECIETIVQFSGLDYKIFVVDNSRCKKKQGDFLKKLSFLFSDEQGILKNCIEIVNAIDFKLTKADKLITVINSENKGFAAANNIVLNQLVFVNSYKYAWLLNNDTLLFPSTLENYITEFETIRTNKKLGILGCVLIYDNDPSIIQGAGGIYYKFLGTSKHILDGEKVANYNPKHHYRIDYPIGASLLISSSFLDDVGPMNESYFLYFEELDWAMRARAKGWECDYASSVFVRHKAGNSIGGKNKLKRKSSLISDYYFYRNRLKFSFTNTPLHFPFVLFIVAASIAYRSLTGRTEFLKLFFTKKKGLN